jgi:hypothetical protein
MLFSFSVTFRKIIIPVVSVIVVACGGAQSGQQPLETRPLEENRALEMILNILHERGYKTTYGTKLKLSNGVEFACDINVDGQNIAIEYLTAKNAADMGGPVPPPAPGSRLHVLPAHAIVTDQGSNTIQSKSIYVFIMDENKYIYQYNPTSDHRADVTYHEVENRIRRDVKDFLSWHESTMAVRNQ